MRGNCQDWSELAQSLVAGRLETMQYTLERYAPVFNQAVVLNAKSLIILMVAPFALVLRDANPSRLPDHPGGH